MSELSDIWIGMTLAAPNVNVDKPEYISSPPLSPGSDNDCVGCGERAEGGVFCEEFKAFGIDGRRVEFRDGVLLGRR